MRNAGSLERHPQRDSAFRTPHSAFPRRRPRTRTPPVTTVPPPEPVEVSRFEANLIRLVRGIVGGMPREQTQAIAFRENPRPKCLRRGAVELVEDALRKGIVRWLARAGWARTRYLRGTGSAAKPVTGRTWERFEEPQRELLFSHHSLEWLMWLTAENPSSSRRRPRISSTALTAGDRLLQLLAVDVLHGSVGALPMVRLPSFLANPLIRLAFPELVAEVADVEPVDFAAWIKPKRTWMLETLQPYLAERWARLETKKQEYTDAARLRRVGESQGAVLGAYLDAVHTAGRWDLARFVAESTRDLLDGTAQALPWFARLNLHGLRMADRTEVYESGLSLVTAFLRLRDWERTARNIGYLDEEYPLAQLWKSEWERWNGEVIADRATELRRRFSLLVVD